MTAGFVHTALKFMLSVIHDMAGGILSQELVFSWQQMLSRPVCIGTQFP